MKLAALNSTMICPKPFGKYGLYMYLLNRMITKRGPVDIERLGLVIFAE